MENKIETKDKRLLKRIKYGKLSKLIQKTFCLFPSGHKAFQDLYRQHISSASLARIGSMRGSVTDRWQRRVLRHAIQSRDLNKLSSLIRQGVDLNMTLSGVFSDTPLMYAVRHGSLEIVEALLQLPNCNSVCRTKNGHSVLDEALHVCLIGSGGKQVSGTRYRIIKCLLNHSIQTLSTSYLDTSIFSVVQTNVGLERIARITKITAHSGCYDVMSMLLCVLSAYQGTVKFLKVLLKHGADAEFYADFSRCLNSTPPQNAVVLVKYASNQPGILKRIKYNAMCNVDCFSQQRNLFEQLFRVLVVCGEHLQLSAMTYLFNERASFYKWVFLYEHQPKSLLDLCRINVRRNFTRNILWSTERIKDLPDAVRRIILLDDIVQ